MRLTDETLVELLLELDPDPVDLFEDALAGALGVVRHPAQSYATWRRVRVQAIEASGLPDDVSVAHDGLGPCI